MNVQSNEISFRSFDGLRLYGTFMAPYATSKEAALLVHGGGVDRDEDGFYVQLAEELAKAGVASLRFDWRAHGQSEGKLEEMTLLEVVNDIHSAIRQTLSLSGKGKAHIVGTSFGGGLSAYFTAKNPSMVQSLVLMNPLLNYKRRLLEEKPFWKKDQLTQEGIDLLDSQGWLPHGSVFKMSRPLLNELFHINPNLEMATVTVPTLTIHGTKDSMVPYVIAKQFHKVSSEYRFISIEGADHGFTLPGDEDYCAPDTIRWQQEAITHGIDWIVRHGEDHNG